MFGDRGDQHNPAEPEELYRQLRDEFYFRTTGKPPPAVGQTGMAADGGWVPLPEGITLVKTLDDWYNCQNVSAQIMQLQQCCQDNSGNPVCPSCGTSCPSCPSCPEPSGGCPSCPPPSCPADSCPPCSGASGESGESGSGESGSGSGSGSGQSGCDISLVNYQLVDGQGTLTVADAIGEIGPLCPWAIDGGGGNWYVPAGTYLKVLPILNGGTGSGSGCSGCDVPLYVAVGLYGSGCQCVTCRSCPSGSCPSCQSCPSGGSCPSCPSGSCPSGSCPSCPSGQSGSGSGSGSGGSGCACVPACPGGGNPTWTEDPFGNCVLDCGAGGCDDCGLETDALGKIQAPKPKPYKGKSIKEILTLLLSDPDVKAAVKEIVNAP